MAVTVVLSEDIIGAEILTRFHCVCRSWKTLFSSPNFIESQLNLTSQNPKIDSLIVNKLLYGTAFFEISILNYNNISETESADVPYDKQSNFSLIGSINGLVCLLEYSLPKQIILWNPATRHCKKIYHPLQQNMTKYICGFSWDPIRNDYKVVFCSLLEKEKKELSLVYSCNSGCWRPLRSFSFPLSATHSCTPAAIVKGVPFWTFAISYCQEKRIYRSIVKFEPGCDEFKLLPVFDYGLPGEHGFTVVCLKDCLTVMLYNTLNRNSLVDVYCLDDEYGVWRKMYNVGPMPCRISKLSHCFNHRGEIVFSVFDDVFCYDNKTKKVTSFCNQRAFWWQWYGYTASLVCIDGMVLLHLVKPA